MDELFSEEAIKEYCFDYDDETDEVKNCYRKNKPMKLAESINIKELLNGNDVIFKVTKGYDESLFEQVDPDVYNEIAYTESESFKKNRRAPPPDCTIENLIENMENVTENGFVKKQILSHGYGEIVPENSYVTVNYNFYKEKDPIPFDSTYLRNSCEKFRLDLPETILGLQYAVKTMRKNENSRFYIKWEYAFGALGCPDRIEPKLDIIADVTLVDFVEVDVEVNENDLTEDEIFKYSFRKSMNEAKMHHVNGSEYYAKGDLFKAISSYRKGLKILNDLNLANEDEEKAMIKQKAKCLVNLAICYNRLGKYELACLACQDVLAIDYSNVKAFFHYGKATLALCNFSQARKWLLKAAELKPNDPDINNELKKLDEKKRLHYADTKKFCEKAFQNISVSKEEK